MKDKYEYSNDLKVVIIGIIKSGQVSLEKYLKLKIGKPGNVHRFEIATHPDGVTAYTKRYKDWIPIIITRDPVERCWSQYWFFRMDKKGMTYKQYLNYFETHPYFGNVNPLYISNYDIHIKRWVEAYPNTRIYTLEEMQLVLEFPHENKTFDYNDIGDRYKPMSPELRQYTKEKLDKLIKDNVCGGGVIGELK